MKCPKVAFRRVLNAPNRETYTYCHEANSATGACASGIVGDRTAGGGLGCSRRFGVRVRVHRRRGVVLGGTALALTLVALILAAEFTHGLTIRGIASWAATTIVVWLVTTVGAISL